MEQVKYGYASNVDDMIERLRCDLLHLDNMSIVYTVKIIIQGGGKEPPPPYPRR